MPTSEPNLTNLATTVFTPNIPIVENDCGTTLGKFETVNYEAEGYVELATGLILSKARINQILSQGIYEVATRHLSTCISSGGVCKTCYVATYPDQPIPSVGDRVVILPEYVLAAEVLTITTGVTSYPLNGQPDTYSKTFVYSEGLRLQTPANYSISNSVLTLTVPPTHDTSMVVHYVDQDLTPFLVWLAETYSGSVFGMKALPRQNLPIRSLLLSSLITENRLQLVSEAIKNYPNVPSSQLEYLDSIEDPLEKSLYILALYSIYSNVTA